MFSDLISLELDIEIAELCVLRLLSIELDIVKYLGVGVVHGISDEHQCLDSVKTSPSPSAQT